MVQFIVVPSTEEPTATQNLGNAKGHNGMAPRHLTLQLIVWLWTWLSAR